MTTIYTTTFSLFLIGVSAQFNHENTQKKLHLDFSHSITLCADTFSLFLHQSFSSIQPFDHSICNHLHFVSSLHFQHNSTMQIPTKPYLDFSHSITLYAISFSSFLHQSSTQFSHANTHKTLLGFQPFDHPICSHLQLVSLLEFQHNLCWALWSLVLFDPV